jgi:hypothetical protein
MFWLAFGIQLRVAGRLLPAQNVSRGEFRESVEITDDVCHRLCLRVGT